MGIAGKVANVVTLPLNAARDVVNAGAGAAGNLLRRGSTLVRSLGKNVNSTAGKVIRGGRRNKTNKNKTNKNKTNKNKSNKNKSNKNRKNKNKTNKNRKNKD